MFGARRASKALAVRFVPLPFTFTFSHTAMPACSFTHTTTTTSVHRAAYTCALLTPTGGTFRRGVTTTDMLLLGTVDGTRLWMPRTHTACFLALFTFTTACLPEQTKRHAWSGCDPLPPSPPHHIILGTVIQFAVG